MQRLQARIYFWNSLSFIITQIKLKDKRNYLHCFIGRCHWFISEYDAEDLFFGYAILGDSRFGEWGYISLEELRQIRIPPRIEVDCELFDPPLKASEIGEIRIR